MATVTQRIKDIQQPRGGYVKVSDFQTIDLEDDAVLNSNENIPATIIGMVVDYLTRFSVGTSAEEAFQISLRGARLAEKFGKAGSINVATQLLKTIKGLDDDSIISACKLVSFDGWYRNPRGAMFAEGYEDINPDAATVQNIRVLVNRGVAFFEKYGKMVKDGFDFKPVGADEETFNKWRKSGEGSFGGYTHVVSNGDGDFLTADTMWDFKVLKSKPTPKHTLQLLMYWIMGQHSGQEIFKNITKIGIFNPRLNTVYLLDVAKISDDVIKTVEREVICYD